ncbi:TatD family hydrolase [Mycoplasma putrefaciens]|uniref:TatD family hydrolase n=1 Tax=Mycoplasma putrefaciens TaxID=2123 RepID=UPI003DA34A96
MQNDKIFDAHIHLNDDYKYQDINIKQVLNEAYQNHVGAWLCASYDLTSSKKAIELSEEFDDVYAAVAIHPNNVSSYDDLVFEQLDQLAKHKKVISIGETGLDYFYSRKNIAKQKDFFKKHIQLAIKHNKVLQIHIRDEKNLYSAYDDVIEIIKSLDHVAKVVVHCFSANEEYAKKFLDLGCYINIGGAVTFQNAKTLQHAVKVIPLDRLLLETDAPYLTPHPFRGQINFPKFIYLTALKVAELKGISVEQVIKQTTLNAKKLFIID